MGIIRRISNKLKFVSAYFFLRHIYNIRYSKYVFKCDGTLINCKLNIRGNGHKIIIAKNCLLKNVRIDITGNNHTLLIDENCRFIESGRIRMSEENGLISIGKNLETSNVFLTTGENNTSIQIGDDCLFSANIVIRSSDGHSIIDSESRRINMGGNVIIEDRVWLGYGVTILKGAHIGSDSVVGTQSLVSKRFPSHSLLAGIPAKIIKTDISWNFKII